VVVGVLLVHAVPVDRGAVGHEVVDDGDLNPVTPISDDGWSCAILVSIERHW
jgi:hypothetical protein